MTVIQGETEGVVLAAVGLSKTYAPRHRGRAAQAVQAAVDVNLAVSHGRTIGLIGESGSGKTTVTRMLLGLEQPTGGEVRFRGVGLTTLDGAGRKEYHRSVAAVFQSPYSSLDPRMKVWQVVTEQLTIEHRPKAERRDRSVELLALVGFSADIGDRYPHQLSGGQRQRVAIARALAAEPDVIVLDEPLSALDVSVQASIVNLLLDLQERLGIAYLFVGHDLAVARQLCDDVLVMRRGHVVEQGPCATVMDAPGEPYTAELLRASQLDEHDLDDPSDPSPQPTMKGIS
ncbi:MAG: ATP-binding cassette domain-containing protein [Ilumatobacteraceae bacterium]